MGQLADFAMLDNDYFAVEEDAIRGLESVLTVVMLVSGAMWITMLTALNVAAQAVAAGWVRGRVVSVYLIFFFGSMAVGSVIWGAVANAIGMTLVFFLAAAVAVVGTFANRWLPLSATEGLDLSP